MLIKSSTLSALNTGFKTLFNKAFAAATPQWQKIAMLVPSENGEETYAWLGALPRFREWIGDRVVKQLSQEGYRIVNKSFEMTVSVPRSAIEDDRYGVFSPMFAQMGRSAALWPESLVFGLLKNGTSKNCYDGKKFFADNHPVGKGTVSNLGTAALSVSAYAAARAAMMAFTDAEGKPLGIVPDMLVVPPALESTAREILLADQISGTTNTYKGTAELIVSTELASDTTGWYLLATVGEIKPLIFQQRKPPEMVEQDDPASESVFRHNAFTYGTDSRGNAGYGLWQQAYHSTGAGS